MNKQYVLKLKRIFAINLSAILILFFSCSIVYGQSGKINGILKDGKGRFVANANIVIKNDRDYVIGFSYSNLQGLYSVQIPDSIRAISLFIEATCIGYKKNKQPVIAGQNTYNFLMLEESIDLTEVTIKNRLKIDVIGDTLSYNVGRFSRPEDRTIGDVIRRLPGVNVAENGQISFNGKAINNLFIHGDDLMDGRYGLATKAISKDMISSIEVMQHFQPINVLKDKVFTDDVAMNLVLKNEKSFKLAGQAMVGVGLPEQYDVALNTMIFNAKIKMLNALKANNSGVDFKNDFAQLGISGFIGDVANLRPGNILTLGTTGSPDLPKENYYLNNSKLLNTNNLINLKGGLQLKSNIQAFLDKNKLDYANSLDNYLNNDTIKYREVQRTINEPYTINASLVATVNKKQYFFNNKFSFNLEGNSANGFLYFNNDGFSQNLKQKALSVANDFNYMPALTNSKNVIDVRWYFSYLNNPQQLIINQGLNSELLNEGVPYVGSNQYVKTPTFFNTVTLAYRIFNEHLIKQGYQFGMINEQQQFNSKLNIVQIDNSM